MQDGAYKAILHSGSLRNVEYASTWVYRIMLNEIFRFLKKEKQLSYEEQTREEGREDVYSDFDLYKALNGLPGEDKAVIQLKYFEDMKLSEIAEVLGENVNTVKSRLYRGLKKLRLELSEN